ncbi:MAG: murein L,D-transpeptidase catalytic domain family protein [Chitinophagaceae bacterium]
MKTLTTSLWATAFFILLLIIPVKNNAGGHKANSSLNSPAVNSIHAVTAVESRSFFLYDALKLKSLGLTKAAFDYAYKGYAYLQQKKMLARASVLTICDFSQSSRRKRFFVIDIDSQKVLINTYVAHGRKSGSEYARSFSNNPDSHMSSLGFYKTETTYYGGNGLSLKIEGLERGFNDKADARNIVIHGSDYVGANFIRSNPFNGRSFGCPAVPANEINNVINTIKNGSCLFIYHPTKKYLTHSKILNSNT